MLVRFAGVIEVSVMLEFIGLITCIYLAFRIFPMVIKQGIKLAVLILLIIFIFACFQIVYHWWLFERVLLIA